MKKIGIITLNGYFNYGNRLQNYALQEILKLQNSEVETILIDNKSQTISETSIFKKIGRICINPSIIFRKINNVLYLGKINAKRERRFREFSNNFIDETAFKISEQYLPEDLLGKYDYFVTGSDQVWNPYFTKASPLYFITFAPKKKRISYSPSFGISELPEEYSENYKSWLMDMESLSVREEAGANIIKKLTGRNAQVVADPTLLLSKKEWLKIAKPARNKPLHKNILLTYFLGEVPKTTKKLINKYKRDYKLTVVNLANSKNKEFYLTDPSEFLDYINTAKLFFTDSFHGSVFSILFETPFIVTDRKGQLPSMNSRITTLLSKFNLQNRHINQIEEEAALNVDFSHIDYILKREREAGFEYLESALSQSEFVK